MDPFPLVERHRIGDVEVVSLVDGEGALGLLENLFPAVPTAEWEPLRARYPAAFRGDHWRLPFRGYAVGDANDGWLLVDTGAGPLPNEFPLDRGDQLGDAMATAGIAPRDVHTVFLTHLHSDHVGGNIVAGAARFPHARFVTHRAGWEWTNLPDRREHPTLAAQVLPLADLGVLDLIDGSTELVAGVTAVATPGHAPGHMSLEIASQGERALILGDVAVHPAQWDHPEWEYLWDVDRAEAVATRRRLIAATAPGTLLLCGHWPQPIAI